MGSGSESFWEHGAGVQGFRFPREACKKDIDILIVGAGFSGCWLAYFLKKRFQRLQITIVERDAFTLGASTKNAGFLSCGNISEWWEDFQELGWEETAKTFSARIDGIRLIQSEFGREIEVVCRGSVDLDDPNAEKVAFMGRLNDHLVELGEKPFYEQRSIRFGGHDRPAFLNRFDGQINPCDLLLKLQHRLIRQGVAIVRSTAVLNVGHGKCELQMPGGTVATVNYGRAFLCTNAFSRRLNRSSEVVPARGQIIVTSPCQTKTFKSLGFLKAGYDYYRFIGDRVLVGGGRRNFQENENTDSIEPTAELRTYLLELATEIVGHGDFQVDFHWAGIMGLKLGRHASVTDFKTPIIIDSKTEEISCCGGWGVTLTPHVMAYRAAHWENKAP